MQNKIRVFQFIFVPLCVFITCLLVVKTLSFFLAQAKSEENLFQTTEWVPAETTVVLQHTISNGQIQEYINEEKISSYSDQTGEHFQLVIEEGQNQFLSFQYKLESEETALKFDTPAVTVFANQTAILQISPSEYDNQWHEAFIDLQKTGLSPGVYDLLFITQNTYDDQFSPNFFVKEVTTTKFFPNAGSTFLFTTNKQVDSVVAEYKIWENEQEMIVQQELESQPNSTAQTNNTAETNSTSEISSISPTFVFSLPENFFGSELSFWSVDLYGNIEEPHYIYLHNSKNLNATQFQSQLFTESEREIFLQFQFQNVDTLPKFFDARISETQISSAQDWEHATVLEHKQFQQFIKADVPVSYSQGMIQTNLVFQNVPGGQRYISIKLCNEALTCEYILQNQTMESHL